MKPESSPDLDPETAFEAAFSPDALHGTYQALLRSHHDAFTDAPRIAAGSDRLTLNRFERQLDLHIAAASRQVLDGRYRFSAFLEREISKDDPGDSRTISIAKIRDVIVQRALYRYMYPAVDAELSDSVFGYRTGRSAHDAVYAIQRHFDEGRTFVMDADLAKFFDSLDHTVLRHKVAALSIDERAKALAWRFSRAARVPSAVTKDTPAGKRYPVVSRTQGVPQGGVLSGLLANLYLASFDAAIRDAGGALVRYADDFVICCTSEAECHRLRRVVENELRPLRVDLHPKKTVTCVRAEDGVQFLGFELKPSSIRIRQKNVASFKQRISAILAASRTRSFRTPDDALLWICGRVNLKVTGPEAPFINRMIANGLASHPARRCWAAFFRIVTDDTQFRVLDRWIRRQISSHMWSVHRTSVRLEQMRAAGLTSLVRQVWRSRNDSLAKSTSSLVGSSSLSVTT